MLQEITKDIGYVTLDDSIVRAGAIEQSNTFFKDNPPPVFVDEIQKPPVLFEQIKVLLDRSRKKGQFFMCGSQQFKMMKGVSESLAGRIGLLTLLGFSLREKYGVAYDDSFLPTDEYFAECKKELADILYDDVLEIIHRGSMPELKFFWAVPHQFQSSLPAGGSDTVGVQWVTMRSLFQSTLPAGGATQTRQMQG